MSVFHSGQTTSAKGTHPAQVQHENLKALWLLSGFAEDVDPTELSTIISEAPDPETACRVITKHVSVSSSALRDKWRKVISQTWLEYHKHASAALTIPLSSLDVAGITILEDVRGMMNELRKQPAKVTYDQNEWAIDPSELARLIAAVPSLKDRDVASVEHEWNYIPLRRMRALLQASRLVRVFKGRVCVVESRYEQFLSLPLPQQYYVLWHTDVYHVDWEAFAGQWRSYVRVMQNYLPLVWEMTEDLESGEECNAENIVQACVEAFNPLWEQEVETGETSLRQLYQRCGLPIVIERLLVRDVLERYGILKSEQSLDLMFTRLLQPHAQGEETLRVTQVGETIMTAEREQDLPCAMDILG